MLRKHLAQWPTIRTDIAKAAKSTLKEARVGDPKKRGGWDEAKALKWAKENGRYHAYESATDIPSMWRGLQLGSRTR